MKSDATYIILNDIKYNIGDKVWDGLDRGKKGEVTFTEGYVCFGEFYAEIFPCYGFYVGDENREQLSEGGLTSSYIKI